MQSYSPRSRTLHCTIQLRLYLTLYREWRGAWRIFSSGETESPQRKDTHISGGSQQDSELPVYKPLLLSQLSHLLFSPHLQIGMGNQGLVDVWKSCTRDRQSESSRETEMKRKAMKGITEQAINIFRETFKYGIQEMRR